jgi:hypothetical protein
LVLEDKGLGREVDFNNYPVIGGVVEGLRKVTILNCYDMGVSRNAVDFERREIIGNGILFDIHLSTIEKPIFSRLRFSSPNLIRWFGPTWLETNHGNRSVSISWKRPRGMRRDIDELRRVGFFAGYRMSSGLVNGSIDFAIQPRLVLKYRERQSWNAVISDAYMLDLFLCFAARTWQGPSEIELVSPSGRARLLGSKRKTLRRPHDVFISQGWYHPRPAEWRRLLFSWDDVQPRLHLVLQKWFANRRTLKRAMSLFWAADTRTVEMRLLFLAQAIEMLHRETIGGSLLEKETFDNIAKDLNSAVPNNLDSDARQALSQRIKFMNEPSFRRRVREVFRSVECIPEYVRDYKTIAALATEYRNEFTHHISSPKSDDERFEEVTRVGDILSDLFELYIWRMLGMTSEEIDRSMKQNWDLVGLRSYHLASINTNS